ncbi:MAG: hypothetical protein F4X18_02250 [Acidimicrobiia bacterium]|nr:hypothetical protein [Acidimicrobiia bacterium]
MTQPAPPSPKPRVLALVVARRGDEIADVLASIESQVYEVEDVVVIADQRPDVAPETARPKTARRLSEALDAIDGPVDYLWMLDSRTTARPDALAALIDAAESLEASVVGSKVLDSDHPDRLLSVGGPTDVFGFPYTGLESGEIDQEQFDVIRDVAFLEPASLLVRRDLAEGLGGLDHTLPYLSFGLDICQRARVVGGRVVVTPGSEVFSRASGAQRPTTWREQAGRLRTMLKTYSLVTLLWVLPALFLVGLATWLYRLAKGSLTGPVDWTRTWAWNLLYLPSTLQARRRAPTTSMESDAELFRFQVRGSLELREIAAELGARLGAGDEQEEPDDRAPPAFWQRPDVITTVLGVALVLVLTRSVSAEGLPATGYVLPLAESAWDTLRAYAGGWHPGGLGSPEPMHPSVGATAALKLLLGNRGGAAGILTVAAVASGVAGMVALVRRLGLSRGARLVGGAVFVAGFPALWLAGEGYWPGLLALGGLPWSLAGVVASDPETGRGWTGRLARVGLATAASAAFVPLSIVIPLVFGLVWGAVARRGRPPVIGAAGSVLALPVLLPWLSGRGVTEVLGMGAPFHPDPSWWVAVPLLVAGVVATVVARGRPLSVVVTGMVIGSVGLLVARAGSLGAGQETTAAGLLAAAAGAALVVAGALDAPASLGIDVSLLRTVPAYAAMVAAILVGLTALIAAPAGRMGLPDDRFGAFAFASSRAEAHGPDRVLLTGPAETMPGQYRVLPDGTPYRLIGGILDYPQAWLPEARLGDAVLEETLVGMIDGQELRPGELLAQFGIRWVAATGPSPLVDAMSGQLDMRPLAGLFVGESGGVWENDMPAYRAATDQGEAWSWAAPDYVGRQSGGSVRIAENADHRWGPGAWQQDGWANRVPAEAGVATFAGVDSFRFQARAAAVVVILLAGLSLVRARRRAGDQPS